MDIQLICELNGYTHWANDPQRRDDVLNSLCRDYDNWKDSDLADYLEKLVRTELKLVIPNWEAISTPVSERNWVTRRYAGRRAVMISYLEVEKIDYYVYIKEKRNGRYGVQFLASVFGDDLTVLPTRKAFTDNFEEGKFYRVRLEKFINNGKFKKYCYDIEETDEETFIWESLTENHPVL